MLSPLLMGMWNQHTLAANNTYAIPFLVPRLLPRPLASRLLGQMVIRVTHVGDICRRSNRVKRIQLVLTAPCTMGDITKMKIFYTVGACTLHYGNALFMQKTLVFIIIIQGSTGAELLEAR